MKTIERTIEKIFEKVGKDLPIDVHCIAESYNIEIKERQMEKDVSGMLLLKKEHSIICINEAHHTNRQRFSIAHELGHYFLHRKQSNVFIDGRFYRDSKSEKGIDTQEIQANQFAADLLMPRELLTKEFNNLQEEYYFDDDFLLEKLAKKFEVSVQAISIRLAKLNLIDNHF